MQEEASFDLGAAVAAVKPTLTIPAPARGQPVLVMLCGLPGTGKSTLARRLARELPAIVIESDRVRQRLFSPPSYSAEESRHVHMVCHILMGWYLRHYYHVVYDATNLYERHRQIVYRLARRSGARLLVVLVTASDEVVRERLMPRRRRKRVPSGATQANAVPVGEVGEDYSEADWEVYRRMRRRAEPIQHEHLTLDTSDGDLDRAVAQVLKAVGGQG